MDAEATATCGPGPLPTPSISLRLIRGTGRWLLKGESLGMLLHSPRHIWTIHLHKLSWHLRNDKELHRWIMRWGMNNNANVSLLLGPLVSASNGMSTRNPPPPPTHKY